MRCITPLYKKSYYIKIVGVRLSIVQSDLREVKLVRRTTKRYSKAMTLLLMVLTLAVVLETMLFFIRALWQQQQIRFFLVGFVAFLYAFAASVWVLTDFSVITSVFSLITAYKIINLLRIAKNRMHEHYLYIATRRTALILFYAQALCVFIWQLDTTFGYGTTVWIDILVTLQLMLAVVLFLNTIRTLNKTRMEQVEPIGAHSSNLPSVTVAIPARNETDELEQCLHELIKSDYPKLEILVLDDCSQLKRTPAIIRDFAHAGVRFLQGSVPKADWTAKNHAYAQLAKQANSEIILFCGVDVRFEPHTIRQLVTTMQNRKKRMLSVLPLRENRHGLQWSLLQPGRYVWELSPPRRFFNRPPVLSTCWLIYRKDLTVYGGFGAVKRMVTPEAFMAKKAVLIGDLYSFVRSTKSTGMTSVKSHAAQRSTAIRTRYPALHKRPEIVALITLILLFLFVATFVLVCLGFVGLVAFETFVVALLSATLLTATYILVAVSTRVNNWFISIFWPLPVMMADIVLMNQSMLQYEFSEVIWKDRNVCLPAMHIVPSLPKS